MDRTALNVIGRAVIGAVALLGAMALDAAPVAADGVRPTNFESVIDEVDPPDDRIEVVVLGGDAFLEVQARPGTEVEVPGYDGEPYLRIEADGTVSRNRRSLATWYNADRLGGEVPDLVDAGAEPDWERIGEDGSVAWHDHRIHWMSEQAPEVDDDRVVQRWQVPLLVDGEQVEVSGRLLRRPDVVPWAAGVLVAVAAATAWWARGERPRRLVLIGASLVALALSLSWYLANPPGAEPSIVPMLLAAGALGVASIGPIVPARAREMVLPLASVALLAGWSVQRVATLWMPMVPGPLPDDLDRLLSAGVAGVAIGVAVSVVMRPVPATRRQDSTASSSGSQSVTPPRS